MIARFLMAGVVVAWGGAALAQDNAQRCRTAKLASLAAGGAFDELAPELDKVHALLPPANASRERYAAGMRRYCADTSLKVLTEARAMLEETMNAAREVQRFCPEGDVLGRQTLEESAGISPMLDGLIADFNASCPAFRN